MNKFKKIIIFEKIMIGLAISFIGFPFTMWVIVWWKYLIIELLPWP